MKLRLLTRMLQWPLVWRYAAKKLAAFPHTDVLGACPPCIAAKRQRRDEHVGCLTMTRDALCVRCELPEPKWKDKPRCPGQPPKRKPLIRRIRIGRQYPVGW